jgi:hypothetical protein
MKPKRKTKNKAKRLEVSKKTEPRCDSSVWITYFRDPESASHASLESLESGFDHWLRVGFLRASLSKQGLGVSTPDTHVAQCALDLGAVLMSEDEIFRKIAKVPGIKLKLFNAS